MTVYTLAAPMPELTIVEGMVLKLEAVNPTTGAAVTGVTALRWAIYGEEAAAVSASAGSSNPGPFMLVPGPEQIL